MEKFNQIKSLLLFIFLLQTAWLAQAADLTPPKVVTSSGTVIGEEQDHIRRFLGIPYAKSPAGTNRWLPPQPITTFGKTLPAQQYGDICPQPIGQSDVNVSEDCLNLNVWAPAKPGKKPVMVWIHGGGFKVGSNRIAGETFAQKGAVVVSLNYRLGPLGFFAHPALEQDNANLGVLDMIAGIKWVKQNIDAFGGDADNITIFGVSAGGMAVNLMVTQPQAKGLFHKAIAQSGYATWPLPRTAKVKPLAGSPSTEIQAEALINSLTPNATVTKSHLLNLSAEILVNAVEGFVLPIVDGTTVIEEPGIRFVNGQQNPVVLMTGGNSFEGSVKPYSGVTDQDYKQFLAEDYDNIKASYHVKQQQLGLSEKVLYQLMWGDQRYLLSALVSAKHMHRVGQPSYLYYVNFVPFSQRNKTFGTTHAMDANMLWQGHRSKEVNVQKVARRLQNYWFNFAKTGSPEGNKKTMGNSNSTTLWQIVEPQKVKWLTIKKHDHFGPVAIEQQLKGFEQHFLQRIKPLIKR